MFINEGIWDFQNIMTLLGSKWLVSPNTQALEVILGNHLYICI